MNIDPATLLRHPLPDHRRSGIGYKPIKYDDTATGKEKVAGHHQEYHQHQKSLPSSLGANQKQILSASSLSAGVRGNAGTATTSAANNKPNGYSTMNGQPFRKINSASAVVNTSYEGTVTALNSNGGGNNASGQSTGGNPRRGGHYAANISAASNLSASGKHQQQQQPLLNLSLLESSTSGNVTSPMNVVNESQFGGQTPPSPSRHCRPLSPLLDLCSMSSTVARDGIGELLASLALMCILSLLMAFLALSFIQRTCSTTLSGGETTNTPVTVPTGNISNKQRLVANAQFNQRIVSNAKEYMKVFQISISLSTLTIALDLCCLFVCCIQFLSIIKLIKTPFGAKRSLEFIKKTSHIRVISIGAFLVSIPIFFTGVILYTFVNFDEIPALITSIIIGIGIIFCGVASVQNVYLWQWEKTKASQDMQQLSQHHHHQHHAQRQSHQRSHSVHGEQRTTPATIYGHGGISAGNTASYPLELSTLV